jgi:hypothetical protein
MKFAIYALVAMTPLLAACPPVTLKQITLNPVGTDGINWGYQSDFAQNGACDFPLPGQGTFLNGLGPATVPNGQFDVGYEDIFNNGAPPIPCQQEERTVYRGHVQFDLSNFPVIAGATLTMGIVGTESQTGSGPNSGPGQMSAATVLGMSTGEIDGDGGPYFWPYDNDVTFLPCSVSLIQPDCSQDVSMQARMWATGAHQNFGFIVAGPIFDPSNPPQDNNASLTWYTNTKLVVLYNPALNPNAPQ